MNIIAIIGLKQMLMPARVILIHYNGIYGYKVNIAFTTMILIDCNDMHEIGV